MGIAIRHGKTAARTVPPGLPEPINCLAGHLDLYPLDVMSSPEAQPLSDQPIKNIIKQCFNIFQELSSKYVSIYLLDMLDIMS